MELTAPAEQQVVEVNQMVAVLLAPLVLSSLPASQTDPTARSFFCWLALHPLPFARPLLLRRLSFALRFERIRSLSLLLSWERWLAHERWSVSLATRRDREGLAPSVDPAHQLQEACSVARRSHPLYSNQAPTDPTKQPCARQLPACATRASLIRVCANRCSVETTRYPFQTRDNREDDS